MKVKAAVLYKPNEPLVIEEIDLDEPRSGEVLVKVMAAGICHSDWHLMSGDTKHPMPLVPGHEGAGIAELTGKDVIGIKPGDFVVLNWAPSCGNSCFYCLNNLPSLCSKYKNSIWAGTMRDNTTRFSKNSSPVYHYSSVSCFA